MGRPPRHPRGQQRDKMCREALRMELAAQDDGVPLKTLRELARVQIEKARAGDSQAFREIADRLDGKAAQTVEHDTSEGADVQEITIRYVHVTPRSLAELETEERLLLEQKGGAKANGSQEVVDDK
jgi:hypothetical protein